MTKKEYEFDNGFVRVLEDSRGMQFNQLGLIKNDRLRILRRPSDDNIFGNFGYTSVNPKNYKFKYLDLELFDVVLGLSDYISNINLDASKHHLEHSEGQKLACENIYSQYLGLLFKEFNEDDYYQTQHKFYDLEDKESIKKNFDWFLDKLEKDGYKVKVEDRGLYRIGVLSGGLIGSFCEFHSNKELEYSGYYNNGKIAVDNSKCFDKLSKCPISIRIPQDDIEYEYLKYYLDLLKSDYGYSLSNQFEFEYIQDYSGLNEFIKNKEEDK